MDAKADEYFGKLNEMIHATAYDARGGVEKLADALNIRAQVLRNKVNPNNLQNKLTVYETVKMMKETGDTRILDELAWMLNFQLTAIEFDKQTSLLNAIVTASADHGKVHQTIEQAVIDKKITPREMERISKEINDAIDALQTLHKVIESKFKNRSPAV